MTKPIEITTRMLLDLSNVQRWCAIRTIKQQSVAEHVFGTLVAAQWLAGYKDDDDHGLLCVGRAELGTVLELLIKHDGVESISGDMPAPFKAMYVPELSKLENAAIGNYDKLCINHAKMADLLEGMAFLKFEIMLGNLSVEPVIDDFEYRLMLVGGGSVIPSWYDDLELKSFPVLDIAHKLMIAKEKAKGEIPF